LIKVNAVSTAKYTILGVGSLMMIFPFVWMVLTSLKTLPDAISIPPTLWPSTFNISNYPESFQIVPLLLYFRNSIIVSIISALLTLCVTVLAAYAFSVFDFWGKKTLFTFCLLIMMIPSEMLIIQNFITVTRIGWMDSFQGIIIPTLASGFYVFMMREYFMQTPITLYKAAKVDGCSDWKYLWKIIIPINKNVLYTIGILSFISHWNAFLWPLMVTNSDKYRVLSIGLVYFKDAVSTRVNLQMAGSTIVIVPMVIFFLVFRKQIIAGVARSGIKG
jgi:multiple sugar transport system permease protein